MARGSILYPNGNPAKRDAARLSLENTGVHPVETFALRHLGKAGGWTAEHIGPARWRLNGVEVDRLLLVTIGFHVRTGRELPVEWLAKTAPRRAAA